MGSGLLDCGELDFWKEPEGTCTGFAESMGCWF